MRACAGPRDGRAARSASATSPTPHAVEQAIDEVRPDAVINARRLDAGRCGGGTRGRGRGSERNRSRHRGRRMRRAGIRCCHVSTDYVFDGTATAPIPETATPAPRSAYGRTKWHGEVAVRELVPGPRHRPHQLAVRPPGPELRAHDAAAGLRASAVAGRRGSAGVRRPGPATSHPRCSACSEIGPPGTYHLTNSGITTWYGLAVATIRARRLTTEVVPITSAEYPTPTARPAYSVLDNRAWRELGEPPLPDWEDGLRATSRALTKRSSAESVLGFGRGPLVRARRRAARRTAPRS